MVWFRWFSEIPGLYSQVPAVHLPGCIPGCFELSIWGDSTGRSLSYMCLQMCCFFWKQTTCFPKNLQQDPSIWVSNGSSNLLRGPLVRSQSIFDGCLFPPQQNKILSMCNNSYTITRVVSNFKLYNLNPLRQIHPSWRAYVAIGYIIVGFLREWCSRAGGNWGTLWSLWGIRGITTPPLRILSHQFCHDLMDGRPTKLDVPSALKFQMCLGAEKTFKKGKVTQRARDN